MSSSSITYWELASVAVIRSFSVIVSTEDGFTSSAEMILGEKKLPFAVKDSSLLFTSSHFAINDTCRSRHLLIFSRGMGRNVLLLFLCDLCSCLHTTVLELYEMTCHKVTDGSWSWQEFQDSSVGSDVLQQ